jgi:hypothetical protein
MLNFNSETVCCFLPKLARVVLCAIMRLKALYRLLAADCQKFGLSQLGRIDISEKYMPSGYVSEENLGKIASRFFTLCLRMAFFDCPCLTLGE